MAVSKPRKGQHVKFHHQGRWVTGEVLSPKKPTLSVFVPYASGGGRDYDVHWTKVFPAGRSNPGKAATVPTATPAILPTTWTPAMVRTNPAGQVQLKIRPEKLKTPRLYLFRGSRAAAEDYAKDARSVGYSGVRMEKKGRSWNVTSYPVTPGGRSRNPMRPGGPVEFDSLSAARYKFAHGHPPRGSGDWHFRLHGSGSSTAFVYNGSYTDAKKAAIREARSLGLNWVTVET